MPKEEILNLWDFMIKLEEAIKQAKEEIKTLAYMHSVELPN